MTTIFSQFGQPPNQVTPIFPQFGQPPNQVTPIYPQFANQVAIAVLSVMHNLHVPLFLQEKAVPVPGGVVFNVRLTAGPPTPYRRNQRVTLNQRMNINPIRVCILDTSVKHKVPVHIHTHALYFSILTTIKDL